MILPGRSIPSEPIVICSVDVWDVHYLCYHYSTIAFHCEPPLVVLATAISFLGYVQGLLLAGREKVVMMETTAEKR